MPLGASEAGLQSPVLSTVHARQRSPCSRNRATSLQLALIRQASGMYPMLSQAHRPDKESILQDADGPAPNHTSRSR